MAAPSQIAVEQRECPECSAQPGEKCRWPDGGTCTARIAVHEEESTEDSYLHLHCSECGTPKSEDPSTMPGDDFCAECREKVDLVEAEAQYAEQ